MKKIIFALCIVNILNGMETSPVTITTSNYITCDWDKSHYNRNIHPLLLAHYRIIDEYPLSNLIVFNTTSNEGFAAYLAKHANMVHSSNEMYSTDIRKTQQKYNHVPRLFFTERICTESYDRFVVFQLPSEKYKLIETLSEYYEGLKPSGDIIATIITQANEVSVEFLLAQNIYSEINNSLPPQKQIRLDKEFPSKDEFLTPQTLEMIIYQTGYEIIAQTNRFFDFCIKDIDAFKELLTLGFTEHLLDPFKLSAKKNKFYCKKFVASMIDRLKRDKENNIIYPYNITELHLRKK